MKKSYTFEVKETITYALTIAAESRDEALEEAKNIMEEGGDILVEVDNSGLMFTDPV